MSVRVCACARACACVCACASVCACECVCVCVCARGCTCACAGVQGSAGVECIVVRVHAHRSMCKAHALCMQGTRRQVRIHAEGVPLLLQNQALQPLALRDFAHMFYKTSVWLSNASSSRMSKYHSKHMHFKHAAAAAAHQGAQCLASAFSKLGRRVSDALLNTHACTPNVQLLPPLIKELNEWTVAQRECAARSLLTTLVLAGEGATSHLDALVPALCAAIGDESTEVRSMR